MIHSALLRVESFNKCKELGRCMQPYNASLPDPAISLGLEQQYKTEQDMQRQIKKLCR